ncbi:MAG TPA: alpha-L-arabinofuranosidase C-terminal domain-containing protein, partial [Gemmatimonadales bacterium]
GLALLGARSGGWRGRTHLADSRIEVLLDEPIGTIAPELYGHFIEHLGGVIYDGVWVGEGSRVANVGGVRRALADALSAIKPGVVRWPGGCFADSYDWRDGVGPRERRPRRTNFWADDPHFKDLGNVPAKYDPNEFGTSEFLRFCRLVGAQPYLAANVRSLPARAFVEWLEYCNSPAGSTTWAGVRAAAGDREPFGVRYWGIGNESWGCGGNFTPEEYAAEYRRFTTWDVPAYGVELRFIGSGPNGGDLEWTRRSFRALAERRGFERMWGWALHHYSSAPNGEAVAFDDAAWYDLLASADRMETLVTSHWQVMGESDREHRVKLVVDEWGAWHKMTTNLDPTHLFGQQSTIRDALVAGLTLDTFNRHADKVAMANIAQLVNCIQSLFLAHEDKFLVTPTYHVFALYAAHQGAQAVRTVLSAPPVSWRDGQGREHSLWGLNGSASRRGDVLTLTVTNPHLTEPREAEIVVRRATVRSATATTLAARDVHDHNTFEAPQRVMPATVEIATRGTPLVHSFAPASVTRLAIALAG